MPESNNLDTSDLNESLSDNPQETAEDAHRTPANHICTLPEKASIVVQYIRYGYFVPLRRILRRFVMVSETHALCKVYFRSSAAIRMERIRHLHHNYYIIHPFSKFELYSGIYRSIILTILYVVIPIDVCFHNVYLTFVKLFLDCATIIGIICTFWTGFLRVSTHSIILDKCDIARRYLCSYFIIDCVTSFNIFFVLLQMHMPATIPLETVIYVKMLNYAKICRVAAWMQHLESYRQDRHFNFYAFKIMKMFLHFILIIWWSACILYVIRLFDDTNSSLYDANINLQYDVFIRSIYHAVYMIFHIGSGDHVTDSIPLLLTQMIILMIGTFLHIYTVTQLMHIVQHFNSSRFKCMEIKQQLNNFLRQREVAGLTKRRVMLYYDYRFQRHFYKEHELLGALSKNLRQEIFLHRCKDLVMNANMFKVIPPSLVNRLVTNLRTKIVLCNDVIVQAGSDGVEMFFIYSGTVAVYTPHGRELCHLKEGASFGEVSLIFPGLKRAATAIAIDVVEMYTLNRQDFFKAIELYPDVIETIRQAAEVHMKDFLIPDVNALKRNYFYEARESGNVSAHDRSV